MLTYKTEGSGLPIVLLHAFPLDRSMWSPTVEALKKHFQVITMDFPGFGNSPLQKDTSTMEDMAKEVFSTLDQIPVREKMVVAGVSMGGYVLFQLHKMAADRLRALAFISTRSTPDTEEGKDRRKKTIELVEAKGLSAFAEQMIPNLFGRTSQEAGLPMIGIARQIMTDGNPKGVCAALRGMAIRSDSTRFLQTINVPTLVVAGDEDAMIPASEMNLMASRIPQARFERIFKAGHLPPLEQADVFTDIFHQFLKRSVL